MCCLRENNTYPCTGDHSYMVKSKISIYDLRKITQRNWQLESIDLKDNNYRLTISMVRVQSH